MEELNKQGTKNLLLLHVSPDKALQDQEYTHTTWILQSSTISSASTCISEQENTIR